MSSPLGYSIFTRKLQSGPNIHSATNEMRSIFFIIYVKQQIPFLKPNAFTPYA